MVYLTCAVIGLGRRGEIIRGLKRQAAAPLHADVRSQLAGSSVIQPLAAREEIGTVVSLFSFPCFLKPERCTDRNNFSERIGSLLAIKYNVSHIRKTG